MEKQKKQFVILVVLLLIGIGAFLGVTIFNKKQEEKNAAEEEAKKIKLTELQVDHVTAISYFFEEQLFSFHLDGTNWIYDGDSSVDIDEIMLEDMIHEVVSLTATETAGKQDALEQYGLDEPRNTITITAEEETVILSIGEENQILGKDYVKLDSSDEIYLVDPSFAETFEVDVENLTVQEEEETEEITE